MSVSSTNRERHAARPDGDGNQFPQAPEAVLAAPPGAQGPGGRPDRDTGGARPGEKTDEQLLSAYREGQRTSFGSLVERYQRELFHFLVRFLGDRAAAEDIFQETFLQVHQSAHQFDPERKFRPWLFTIAANKARDLMRSQARRPTNPLQASVNAGDDESGEFMDLMSSVDAVPEIGRA